jgi:hypothetical protein
MQAVTDPVQKFCDRQRADFNEGRDIASAHIWPLLVRIFAALLGV